ncbi:MAG: ATP-binding protein [Saprospirales bacterium]|nr:ATP-binding protein [Saprospirales bacterium]
MGVVFPPDPGGWGRVVKQFPGKPLEVLLDPSLIEQVFINLIKNALEAIADTSGPVITLSVAKDPSGLVEISIADNGPGIPEDLLSQVFIPFLRLKKKEAA